MFHLVGSLVFHFLLEFKQATSGSSVPEGCVGVGSQDLLIWMVLSGVNSKCPWHSSDSTWRWTRAAHHRCHSYVCPWWWLCIWASCHGEGSWKFSFQLSLWSHIQWAYILHLATVFFCSGKNVVLSLWTPMHPVMYANNLHISYIMWYGPQNPVFLSRREFESWGV